MLTANYTSTRKVHFVTISRVDGGRRQHVATIHVSGKVEARRVAAEHGAKCWNF